MLPEGRKMSFISSSALSRGVTYCGDGKILRAPLEGKTSEEIIDHSLSACCETAGFNLMLFLLLLKTEVALTLDALVFKLF